MLNSDDAQNPSENVHTLVGSSQPGAAPVVHPEMVATVAEMPETFEKLGTAANRVFAAIREARVAKADLIEFAEKTLRLVEKADAAEWEASKLSDHVMRERPYPFEGDRKSADCMRRDLDWMRANLPSAAMTPEAIANVERRIAEIEAWEQEEMRFEAEIGVKRADAKSGHLIDRLSERVAELAEMPAATMRDLAAKAAVGQALAGAALDSDDWGLALSRSIAADVVRLQQPSAPPTGVKELTEEWLGTSSRYFRLLYRADEVGEDEPAYAEIDRKRRCANAEDERVREKIINLWSSHPDVLALKAAAFLTHCGGRQWIDGAIRMLVRETGLFEEAIAMSLARDVVDGIGLAAEALATVALAKSPLRNAPLTECNRLDGADLSTDSPAQPPRDAVESYRTFLHHELRMLNLELDGNVDGHGIWLDNEASWFHFPDQDWRDLPKPSSRAMQVLDMMKIDWRSDVRRQARMASEPEATAA